MNWSSSSIGLGKVFGGSLKSCIRALGISLGFPPVKSARIFPLSPTNSRPSSGISSPSSSSSLGVADASRRRTNGSHRWHVHRAPGIPSESLKPWDRKPVDLFGQVPSVDFPELAAAGFNAAAGAEIQNLEDLVKTVVAHVAQRAGAEIIPAAEDGVRVGWVIGPCAGRAQPEIPVKPSGTGGVSPRVIPSSPAARRAGRTSYALREPAQSRRAAIHSAMVGVVV